MMDFERATRARLLAWPAVKALVRDRVDWTNRPSRDAMPAIALLVVYDPRPRHMKGPTGFRGVRVQIDCWALRMPDKVALREAVLGALEASGIFHGVRFGGLRNVSIRDLGEDAEGGFLHRDSIDAVIWTNG